MGTITDINAYKRTTHHKNRIYHNPYVIIMLFILFFCSLLVMFKSFTDAPATYALIAINGIVFGLIYFKKLFISILWTSYDLTLRKKEYYRLITSSFTHKEVWHILMNMASLQNLGTVLEPFLGSKLFITAYVIIMLVGGVFSCLIHKLLNHNSNSIGASGILCGLMGIYLVFVVRISGIAGLRSCALSLVFLVLMLFSKHIDNIGHFTGMLTGICFGCILLLI